MSERSLMVNLKQLDPNSDTVEHGYSEYAFPGFTVTLKLFSFPVV